MYGKGIPYDSLVVKLSVVSDPYDMSTTADFTFQVEINGQTLIMSMNDLKEHNEQGEHERCEVIRG